MFLKSLQMMQNILGLTASCMPRLKHRLRLRYIMINHLKTKNVQSHQLPSLSAVTKKICHRNSVTMAVKFWRL